MADNAPSKRFTERYADFVLKYRMPIVIFLVVATIIAATQIPKLDIRNDPDTLLPPTNRYVATNLYAEHNFGMGNIMVFSMGVKEGDIYQPWFINKVQEVHRKLEALPTSRPANFIDIAAQKIKYMTADENGLVFKRLIPTEGISSDPGEAKKQLAFLKEGIKTNPVMAPMLVAMYDKNTGKRCAYDDYDKDFCVAKAAYILADYTDDVKKIYLPWVKQVQDIMKEVEKDDRIQLLVAGEPYFLAYMLADLVNKWWLFVISIAIVVAILWMEFRDWRGAAFPLLGVGMTIVFTLGLMGFTQFKLTTMMVLTPMLLLAIGIGHSVQVTRRFLLEMGSTGDCERAAHVAISHTIIPATLSIITDMVGFATLATVDISFYKAYAYFGMFGMLTLLLTTTTQIPLLLSRFTPSREACGAGGHSWEATVGGWLTRIVMGPGKVVPIVLILVLMGVSFYYTNFMNWKNDPVAEARLADEGDIMPGVEKGINYARAAFKGSSKVWKDLVKLNQVMPGVISVSIPIRGKEPVAPECEGDNLFPDEVYDIEDLKVKKQRCAQEKKKRGCWDTEACGAQGIFNDADVLADIEKMEKWMRAQKFVGYTGSYAQYVRLVNMLLMAEGKTSKEDLAIPTREYLTKKDPNDDRDPDQIVQLYNGLLEMMTSAGDMDSFISKDWNEGVVLGFINTMDPRETHQITMDIQSYIEAHKNDKGFRKVKFGLRCGPADDAKVVAECDERLGKPGPNYLRPGLGGFLGATEATREVAMANWLVGPLQTALAVFIIVWLIFRSFTVASMLIVTLFITLFAQYGLGGYFTSVENWSGNLAFHLLVTLSIAMGLGIDYGIYILSRLREEMQATEGDWAKSLRNTLNTTGSAVIISIVVLLGSFIPLLNTNLANTWGLAIYIGEALIIDVFTALMLLPMMVRWFKPRYVFKTNC